MAPRRDGDTTPDPPNQRRNGRSEWPDPRLEWWLLEHARAAVSGRRVRWTGRKRRVRVPAQWLARIRHLVSARLPGLRTHLSRAGVAGKAKLRWRRRRPAADVAVPADASPWPWAIAGSSLAAAVTAIALMLHGTAPAPQHGPPIVGTGTESSGVTPKTLAPAVQAVPSQSTSSRASFVPAGRVERAPRAPDRVAPAPASRNRDQALADSTPMDYGNWEQPSLPGYGPMHDDMRDPATGMTVQELERAVEYYFAEGEVDDALEYLRHLERLRSAQPPAMPN